MADQELRYKILTSVVGAQAVDGLKKSIDGIGTSTDKLSGGFTKAASAVKAFAAAYVVKEGVSFVKNLIDTGDELQAMSEKTGIAASALYGYKIAAETANTDINALGGGFKKLAVNMVEAAGGNEDLNRVFRGLGISLKDMNGQLRPTGEIVEGVADKFSKMKDGPEKAALAVKLFGKSGNDLIPFLNQGKEALQEFSLAFGDDFSARADQFNDTVTKIQTNMKKGLLEGVNELLPVLQDVLNIFSDLPGEGEGVINVMDIIGETIRLTSVAFVDFSEGVKQAFDILVTGARVAWEKIKAFFELIGDAISTRAQQLAALATLDFDKVSQLEVGFDKRSTDRLAKETTEIDGLLDGFVVRSNKRADRMAEFTSKTLRNSLLFGDGTVDEIKKRTREETKPAKPKTSGGTPDVESLGDNSKKYAKEQEELQKLVTTQAKYLTGKQLELDAVNMSTLEYKKAADANAFMADAQEKTIGMTEQGKKEYLETAEALKELRAQMIETQYEQERSFGAGAKEFLRDYAEEATNTAKQVKEVFGTAFNGLEDALTNFVKTGKLNFKDFANAVIDDIIRIAIRRAILAPIANALGGGFGGSTAAFANGGIMTAGGPVSLKKYANGGIANSPQLALFGEGRSPEAYVPLPDGRSIPVTMKSDGQAQGQAGGNTSVVVNVNMQTGETDNKSTSENGRQLGVLISSAVKQELIQQKRPGGLLAT